MLVVEDDTLVRRTIREALQDEGLAVEAFADGWEALKCAARQRPSLAVIDWCLPGMSGAEVAAGLRAAYPGTVPIVVISADPDVARHAWDVRAYTCLAKPFHLDELVAAVCIGLGAP